MNTRPPPTLDDVLRYLNGEIHDPLEQDWLEDWYERDPEIRAWFDALDVESALEEIADNAPGLPSDEIAAARQLCRDLDASRLSPIILYSEDHEKILDGRDVSACVLKEAAGWSGGGTVVDVDCKFKADRAEPGTYRLLVPQLPAAMRPLNLTLAGLGLGAEPALRPFSGRLQIEWSPKVRDKHEDDRHLAGPNLARPAASQDSRNAPSIAAALGAETFRLAADDQRGPAIKVESIRSKSGAHDTLRIACPARLGRTHEPLMLEVRFINYFGESFYLRKALVVSDRRESGGAEHFTTEVPIELPLEVNLDADGGMYDVNVRSADVRDLPRFDSRTASSLLAEHELTALPLTADGDGYRFRIREQDRAAIADVSRTWLVRWAPAEWEVKA